MSVFMPETPETKLKRFLHLGQEAPVYQFQGDLCQTILTSIDQLIADNKASDVVTHIIKAFTDGYSANEKFLVYALAYCATTRLSVPLRVAAYSAFKTICDTPENMFFFIKCCSERTRKLGWGSGMRRALKQWYTDRDPLVLAGIVTRCNKLYRWSHKDILKLVHLSPRGIPGILPVLHYLYFGLPSTQTMYKGKKDVIQVVEYLEAVYEFKHSKNVSDAVFLLETCHFTVDHLPPHLVKSPEIWKALVPLLPLRELLKNLIRLGRMRFLKASHPVKARVMEALENQAALEESNLHPAEILVATRKYELCGKLRYVPSDPAKALQTVHQPNSKIINALYALLESSFKLLASTGLRYFVAIDTKYEMLNAVCPHSRVRAMQAAALLALTLVKAERDVTVMAFGTEEMTPILLNKETTLAQAHTLLKKTTSISKDLVTPITWAEQTRKPVDVFVIITDGHLFFKTTPEQALRNYRQALDLPNAKLVVCTLGCSDFRCAAPEDPGMLDIAGFEGQVPRIIEAFSRGAF